jgi:hypothetical protein
VKTTSAWMLAWKGAAQRAAKNSGRRGRINRDFMRIVGV